jgi:MFS family permease
VNPPGRVTSNDRDTWPFYAFALAGSFLPYLAILPYLYLNCGLSVAEITWLTAAGNVAITLLEVPTGALADRYGRRMSLVTGMVLVMAGLGLTMVLPKTFFTFLVWVIIHASGVAFVSGADQALLYDYLAATGRKEKFHAITGRYSGLGRACGFVATVAAGPLLVWGGFNLVLAVALGAQAVAFVAALRMPAMGETPARGRRRPPYREVVSQAWREMRLGRDLLFCLVFSALLLTAAGLAWEYRSLLVEVKVPAHPEAVSAVTAVLTLLFSLSMFLAGYTKRLFARDRALVSYLVMPLGIIGAALLPGPWGLAALVVYIAGGGVFNVHFRVVLNEAIRTPELRATILSTINLADRGVYTLFALGFGAAATFGFTWALAASGALLVVLYFLILAVRWVPGQRASSRGQSGGTW